MFSEAHLEIQGRACKNHYKVWQFGPAKSRKIVETVIKILKILEFLEKLARSLDETQKKNTRLAST